MNADERTPGQQGYGEQSPQQQTGQQQQRKQDQDGGMSTGQASYGNSGETATDTVSQNKTDLGQEADRGEGGQGRDTGLFSGSQSDMGGSEGTGRTGIDGSIDQSSQSGSDIGGSTGRSGIEGSLDSIVDSTDVQADADQDFANQGQGALNEDLMGSDRESGTTDIEVERSQGRENDIEGSSL